MSNAVWSFRPIFLAGPFRVLFDCLGDLTSGVLRVTGISLEKGYTSEAGNCECLIFWRYLPVINCTAGSGKW
jgi:hypothetical protein